MSPWTAITAFGDFAVMAPAALAIMLWLFVAGEGRLAFWWGTLFAAGMGAVVATKIAFIGWGVGIDALDFTGISGHAMRAGAVLPVMSYLALQKSSPALRAGGVSLGFAGAILIGISRLEVHAHSVSEVVSGMLLGSAVALGFMRMAGAMGSHVLNRTRIALSLIALLAASCTGPAPTQHWIVKATLYLTGHEQPHMRAVGKLPRPPLLGSEDL
jgi:membrane-associated phospholipid phosphatase